MQFKNANFRTVIFGHLTNLVCKYSKLLFAQNDLSNNLEPILLFLEFSFYREKFEILYVEFQFPIFLYSLFGIRICSFKILTRRPIVFGDRLSFSDRLSTATDSPLATDRLATDSPYTFYLTTFENFKIIKLKNCFLF